MTKQSILKKSNVVLFLLILTVIILPQFIVSAAGELSITPITWNVIGLDSNDETAGPNQFPVGARVCNIGDADVTNVTSNFEWTTNPSPNYINNRPGTKTEYLDPGITLTPGDCYDFYYEVEVDRVAAAKGTSRGYKINAFSDGGLTASTPDNRELYVEWLISQSRNSVVNIFVKDLSNPASSPVLIADGGTMTLEVGKQYEITLEGSTATNGYNQLESFINFPNTIFKILSVQSTYSAFPGGGPGTSDTLYADSCGWENDITDPNYKSCVVSDDKAGGSVVNVYTVEILSVGSINPEPLNSELYDFSGSSFHYNADFDVSVRYAAIIDPTLLDISKKFSPNPTNVGGTSKLTFTISNPFPVTIEGASFVDNLPTTPGAMLVADPAGITTSGCGSPTVTATAGAASISVSNASVAANSSCSISVNVTAPVVGTYNNTTETLKYLNNGEVTDTGNTASASLTVDTSPPAPADICGLNLATWTMDPAQGLTSPPTYSYKATNVSSAVANIGAGVIGYIDTSGNPANQWSIYGFEKTTFSTADNDYIEFAVDTTNYSDVKITLDQKIKASGPAELYFYWSTDGLTYNYLGSTIGDATGSSFPTTSWTTITKDYSAIANSSGITYFRIYGFDANNGNSGSDLDIDNVNITGCGVPQNLTITKNFSPDAIPVNSISTLSFSISNPNPIQANAVAFTDDLPSGIEVASVPNIQLSNCGSAVFSPSSGDTSLSFTSGSIAAYGTCTAQVDVVGTSAGPKTNVSGFISSTETSVNTNPDGYATDNITVILPPEISKSFASTPIYTNGTSLLTIKIKNPNQDEALTGVSFVDNLPTNITIANPLTPAATNTCTGGVLTAVAGGTSISVSGASLVGGETCEVTVTVTSSVAGNYTNTTNPVNSTNAGQGNTASSSILVKEPTPGISFLKEISTSTTGPWTKFVSVTPGTTVYYRFTVENIGDVPLNSVTIQDSNIDASSCSFTDPLPVAVAANENHISTCVSSGVVTTSGQVVNTATAKATYNTTEYTSNSSSATYVGAEPSLSLLKEISQSATGPWSSSITGVNPGSDVYYRFTIENTGNVELQTINVTDPDITMTGCTFTDPLAALASTSCVVGPVTASNTIGIYSNTATAHGTYKYDGNTYDSSPSTANYTITSPDLIVDKTNNVSDSVSLGDSFTWTITVTNNGTSDATFAVGEEILTDSLPTGATYTVGASPAGTNCAIDGSNVLTCTPTGSSLTLAASDTFVITVSATTTSTGDLINTVTVDDDGLITESDETNNSDTDTVTVTLNSNLTIAKTNTVSDAVDLGDSFTWTITITNSGSGSVNFAIDNVLLSDTLPLGATYALSASYPSDVSCNIADGATAADPKTFSCKATAPLSIASSGTLGVTLEVTPTSVGSLANTATVDPNNEIAESNETDNTGSNTVTVSAPNLTITKTNAVSDAVVLGDSFTWTITVTNSGTSAADFAIGEIILSDSLPTGATYAVTSSPAGTNCAIDGSNVLTCTPTGSPLSIATSGSLTVAISVTPTSIGSLANTATVDPNNEIAESNETDNTGSNTVTVSAPNLTITKTNTVSDAVVLGDSFTWTITVTNSGTSAADFAIGEIILSDSLPTGATYAVTSSPAGTNCAIDGSNVLTCTPTGSPLSIATSGSLAVAISVTPTSIGSLANTATVDPNNEISESNETDNTGSNTVTVSALNLTITKTNTVSDAVVLGDSFTWTITVTNSGTSAADFAIGEIILSDSLPTGATYAVTSSPAGTNCAIDGSNVLTCTPTGSPLSIATSGSLAVAISVTPTSIGSLANTATVDPNNEISESNETDNTGSNTVTVSAPNLTITKTNAVSDAVVLGDSFTWTITVTNSGTSAADFAIGEIILSDSLPTGATYAVTSSPAGTNCAIDGSNVLTCTPTGSPLSIATSGSLAVAISVTPTSIGSLANTATVDPDNEIAESNETDNTGSNTVTVSAPNLTITKTNTVSDAVVLGDSFTWTITVTNSGTSAADFAIGEIILSDSLPTGATYAVTSSPAGTNCAIDGSNVLTCTPTGSPLSIATSGSLAVAISVTPTSIGSLANTATVDPNNEISESNETDNTGSNTVTVSAPNLTITKTNNVSGNIVVGNSFNWTISVTNNGNSNAVFAIGDEILTDSLPSGATYSIGTSPAYLSCSIDGSNVLTCSPIGATLTMVPTDAFNVVVSVTTTSVGNLNNTAVVDDDGLITESNESDNSSNDIVAVNAKQIDLELTKNVNNATPSIGNNVFFTLTVTNNGSDDASGVVVQDLLPSGFTYLTDSEVGNLDSYNANTGVWTVGAVTSGGSVSITIEATVNGSGVYKNIAEVSAANETDIDSTPNNDDGDQSEDDEASALVTVNNVIGLAKQVDTMTEISTGTYRITYEFFVKNYGTDDLPDLQITDALDTIFILPTTFTVYSLTSSDFSINSSFDGSSDINLLLGTDVLIAGTSGTVQLTIDVIPYASGPFNNTSTVYATHSILGTISDVSDNGADPDGDGDGNPTNDSDPTPVDFGPNLFDPPIGFKWLDADNNPILTWTMVWINNSNIVAINAEAYDEIPVGTAFYDNGITSGYVLPGTAPVGSTNTGVICTDSSVITTTTYCYYEGPTVTYPRGRIVWVGNLGPDLNQTTPSAAVNDIAITFNVQLDQSNSVTNTAYINSDLNGDGDVDDAGELQVASASASWGSASVLPASGFKKDQITKINNEEKSYMSYNSILLKIEKLGVEVPIVGVPQVNNQWDVTWLGNQAGWLQNTAFPTSQGNSAITGHVYDQNGLPGPFINLKTLSWGDEIVIIENGQQFVYKVNDLYLTKPNNVSSLANTDETILTLITCQNYDEENDEYLDRLIVTAKLVEIR